MLLSRGISHIARPVRVMLAMLLVTVALGAMTLTAGAQDPIAACKNIFTGQVRIVADVANCNPNEEQLEFASQAQINDVQDQIDALDVRVTDLETRMNDAETRLDDHDTQLADHETRITDLETGLAALEVRVGDLEVDLSSLTTLVNSIVTTLNDLIGSVDTITGCIQTFNIDFVFFELVIVDPVGTITCLANVLIPPLIP